MLHTKRQEWKMNMGKAISKNADAGCSIIWVIEDADAQGGLCVRHQAVPKGCNTSKTTVPTNLLLLHLHKFCKS